MAGMTREQKKLYKRARKAVKPLASALVVLEELGVLPPSALTQEYKKKHKEMRDLKKSGE